MIYTWAIWDFLFFKIREKKMRKATWSVKVSRLTQNHKYVTIVSVPENHKFKYIAQSLKKLNLPKSYLDSYLRQIKQVVLKGSLLHVSFIWQAE